MGNVTEIFKLSVSKFTKLCDFTGDDFIVIYFRMVDPGFKIILIQITINILSLILESHGPSFC